MKCPRCGAWSSVLQSRANKYEQQRRRRVCANGHRFSTLEAVVTKQAKGEKPC